MLKYVVSAACLAIAVPAFAQDSGAAAPQAPQLTGPQLAIQQAAMAFGQCVQAGVRGVGADVTPEAGATAVMAGCATQKQALEAAAQSYIATMPEAERAGAQEHLRSGLAGAETQIAGAIRQSRTAAAAPATPAAPAAPAH
jgi:hypothetical protein